MERPNAIAFSIDQQQKKVLFVGAEKMLRKIQMYIIKQGIKFFDMTFDFTQFPKTNLTVFFSDEIDCNNFKSNHIDNILQIN